jgi:hypothetical protein
MATIKVKRTTGSTIPSGLTFGEPAYVQGLKSLYIGQTGGDPAIRIGAEVTTDGTFGSASDNKIPTQLAVKTYVDSNVAAGAVSTLNGLTGAVFIGAGTGIGLAAADKGITLTNTGVQSISGASGISVSGSTGNVSILNTGVRSILAATNITLTGTSGDNIQIGTSLTPSFTTVTTTSVVNVGSDLNVTGNLVVNGNTTTVNSNTLTIDDPIIMLGLSGGEPLKISDGGKDRGVAFTYFDSVGKTGFFGWDAGGSRFVFAGVAAISSEIVSPTTFSPVQASNFVLTEPISQNTITIAPEGGASNNPTFTLPDWSGGGSIVVANNAGTSTNYILKSNGLTVPTWIDPSIAGFTAFTSANVSLAVDTTDTQTFLVFSQIGATGNQQLRYNAGLTYNAVANSLSATTFVGALSGNATTATTLQTARTIGLTGDVWGSASFNGGSDINITATIQANSITLGTDTTGQYASTISSSGSGLSITSPNADDATAYSISLTKINSGIDFGTFAFTTNEFTNNGSGTVAIGTVDGGSF